MLQAQIFISKQEMKGAQPAYEYILEYLIQEGIGGATVLRGSLGYGKDRWLNRPNDLFSFDETPMIILFVDEDEKIKTILTKLRPIVRNTFIITSQVEEWK